VKPRIRIINTERGGNPRGGFQVNGELTEGERYASEQRAPDEDDDMEDYA